MQGWGEVVLNYLTRSIVRIRPKPPVDGTFEVTFCPFQRTFAG